MTYAPSRMSKSLQDAELSVRTKNACNKMWPGIEFEELLQKPDEVLKQVPNLGRRSINELRDYNQPDLPIPHALKPSRSPEYALARLSYEAGWRAHERGENLDLAMRGFERFFT